MPTKKYYQEHKKELEQYERQYFKCKPWAKTWHNINSRVNNTNVRKCYIGIKNYLTFSDLKYLWERDNAYLLKRPSIDRIDSKSHYTINNCRYIELYDNCVQAGRKSKGIKRSQDFKDKVSRGVKEYWRNKNISAGLN